MILPIVAYGTDILRKQAIEITKDYPQLNTIINDMWETMYYTNGVGLAAPQVNLGIRIFVADSQQMFDNQDEDEEIDFPDAPGKKQVFINPSIVKTEGENWYYKEGCLSIPRIRENVERPESVTLHYFDENFIEKTEVFNGITARIILHEFDHLEGKLFIDYLPALKKKLLQSKLTNISKGKIDVDYRMSFPKK